ncbi:cytochrome c3 family protein [Phosphitispora fastidiosa]|uniref:cytochrome c3 family protein n=1 Tax=Phosphitispora fastidiosa TaxID=2837202 RepID=UPI001E2B25AA|nr:cytochrome c3 family protein [Phosphitispora fastidiosa]MBU7006711.1 hypothetical protein [Phosphitispora fastidiosa]
MKKIILAVLGLFVIMTLFASSGGGASAAGADCANCHGTNVSDFTVASPVLGETCTVCHGVISARHSSPGWIAAYVDGAGYFKSPDSVLTGPPNIHSYHNGMNTPAGSDACARCHRAASCETCHTPVNHKPHGSTEMESYPSYTVAIGIGFGSQDISCSASNCHKFYSPGIVPSGPDDTTNLCFNCHSTDKTGHDDTQLAAVHTTTFPSELMFSGQLTGFYPVDCSGCHNSTLDTEHANQDIDCFTCHNSTNTAILNVIDTAGGLAANRSCDKCHFNAGVIPVPEEHTLFHIATESSNLRIDGAPHDSCNTCHQRQEIFPKIAALAGSSVKNYSCLDCHNGDGTSGSNPKAPVHSADYNGQQMNIMDVHASCATCHTPDTTYAAAIDTIIAENRSDSYSCTECHTDLSAGHKAAFEGVVYDDTTAFHLKCTDCHKPTYKSTITRLKDEVKLGGSYDCSACHTAVALKGDSPYYPAHAAGSDEIVGFHPQSCNTCHGTANGQYVISLDPMRDNLPASGYACTECHNGTIANDPYHQAKADAAANPEDVSTTYHQACSTCHGNSVVRQVLDGLKGTVTAPYLCSECHNETLDMAPNHKAKMVAADTAEATITDYHLDADGETACGMCHGSARLPEGTIAALKTETAYLCDDCHTPDSVITYSHTADFGTAAVDQNTTGYHAACQSCHDSAAAKPVIKELIGQSSYDCSRCHNGTVTYAALHQADMDTASGPADTVAYHPDCLTCHGSGDADVSGFIESNKGVSDSYMCSDCHGDIQTRHVSTSSLTGGMINCSWCHSNQLIDTHVNPGIDLPRAMDCATCHDPASPVRDQIALGLTRCEDCHNGTDAERSHPDSQYYPRHIANPFPVFMPEYDTDCSTCHTNNSLITLHSDIYVGCNTCHYIEAYKPAVISLSVDCSGCHNADINPAMDMVDTHKEFHFADLSTYPETTGCLECHAGDATADGQSLLGVHKKDSASTVSCDTCHGAAARQTAKDAIAANNISCQACHGTGTGHEHNVAANGYAAAPQVNCSACHKDAADGTAELAAVHQDAADRGLIADYSCSTCHNPIFEGTVIVKDGSLDMLSGGTPIYCTGCHNGTLADALGTKYPAHDGNHINATGYGAYQGTYNGIAFNDSMLSCVGCHPSLDTKVVHDKDNLNCNLCHNSTNAAVQSVIKGSWSRADTPAAYTCSDCHNTLPYKHMPEHKSYGMDPIECNSCHDGTNAVGNFNAPNLPGYTTANVTDIHLAADGTKDCNLCHASTKENVVWNINHFKDRVSPPYYCENCHSGHNEQHEVTSYLKDSADTSCSKCHTNHVAFQHSGLWDVSMSCQTCHTLEPALPDTLPTIWANLSNKTAPPGFTCQDCHTGIQQGHSHPVAANGYAAAPEVNCSACHSDTADGTAELAAVHQDAADRGLITDYGCDTCHNAAFEGIVIPMDGSLDMLSNGTPIYCTDCHNGTLADALGTKYPAHDGNHSTTANGYGLYNWDSSVDCAQCHTTLDIYDNHIYTGSAADCNSCHANTAAGVVGVIESNWSRTADKAGYNCSDCHNSLTYGHRYEHTGTGDEPVTCSGCHNGTAVTGAFNAPAGTTATVSDSDIHPTCNKCHTTANSVVQAFIDAGTGQDNSVYACSACHDSITPKHNKMHEVTAFTADGATGCANCHQKDVTAQHSESFKAGLNCDTCHGAGAAAALPETPEIITSNLSSNVNRTGYTCTDCHGSVSHQHRVAKNGYQSGQAGAGSAECSTCHATDVSTGETELASLHENAGITGYGCSTCHNSTFEGTGKVISGDGSLNMNRNGQSIYCADCHNGTLTNTVDSGHQPEHLAKHSATNMDCSSCHGFSAAAGEAADIKSAAVHSDGCVTCHGDNVRSDVKILVAAKTGQNNPIYDCEDCHSVIHLGWEQLHKPVFPTDTDMNCANCHNNYLPGEHTRYFDTGDSTGGTDETGSKVAYKVFRSSDGSTWSQAGTTTGTAFSIGGLTPVTQYWFKVQAYDAAGNVSGFSNTATATTKAAPVTSPSETVGPDDARWGKNIDADRYYDRNIDSTVTSRLSDNNDGSNVEIRENGDGDWWVYVRADKDARDYSSVKLKVRFRWDDSDWSGNMLFYPYKSDGKNINTGAVVDYKLSRPSTSYTWYEVDVTEAAHAMDGYGFIKFRIKPGRDGSAERAKLSEVSFILESQGSTGSEDSVTTSSTTVPADNSGTDTVPPTDPTGLTAGAYNSAQLDLAWTASTDSSRPAPTPVEGEARTCALCHSSTVRADVKTAVAGGNANCSACHTIHGDIGTMHTAPAYGFSGYTWNCGKCHTTVLTDEHANRGLDCATCHDSAKAKVQGAIATTAADGSNRRCSNCHTGTADGAGVIHSDLNSAHLTGIFPTATDSDCLNCHSTQQQDFVSAKGSYHVVDTLTSKANSSYGTYVSPWTATSYVGCQGCHGASTPGGTLAYANILKRPYTYTSSSRQSDMLCFMCHDRYTYGVGGESAGRTGFSDGDNLHNIGDHNEDGLRCSWCHASMPHGTNKAHLIVTIGEPNSKGNVLTNFTHPASGQYRESSCGSNVNECDEHDEY